MNKYDIQKLRDLPIESVAARLGLEVKRHKSLCPFHEDSHPSLSYRTSTNTFKCFVCDAHGGTIDLAMKVLNKPFKEACEWLANENNIIIEQYAPAVKQIRHYPPDVDFLSGLVAKPVLNESARHFLFDQRKLSPKVIEWCGISSISYPTPCWRYGKPFYDAPSLLFPYRDINGNVLNVQSRYLGCEKGKPRFRFPSNSSIHIFNLPILRYAKPDDPIFIAEGITDCLSHLSMGHISIAIPSATLLKPEDLEPIRGHNLYIFPDKDNAGEQLYRRLLQVATQLGCCLTRCELPDDCKDFSDYYVKHIKA